MKISIDETQCVGCGLCEELLPAIFKMHNEVARVIRQPRGKEEGKQVIEVSEDCPAEAISIEEENVIDFSA